MTKYIFYIFISALLIIGCHQVNYIELQGLPDKTEALAIDNFSSNESRGCMFTTITEHSSQDYHTFNDVTHISFIADCILGGFTFSRSSAPCKLLKFNPITTVVHHLSCLDEELLLSRFRNLISTISDVKKTKIYYIYTLSHIII